MDGMNVDELLTIVSLKEGLNPAEHFVRIKKRKDMSTLKYFVPHRTDLIDTYVSKCICNCTSFLKVTPMKLCTKIHTNSVLATHTRSD